MIGSSDSAVADHELPADSRTSMPEHVRRMVLERTMGESGPLLAIYIRLRAIQLQRNIFRSV